MAEVKRQLFSSYASAAIARHLSKGISLARATPALENSNFTNNLPLKKAERKSKTSYDYSEEEMMAAIEQEYGR